MKRALAIAAAAIVAIAAALWFAPPLSPDTRIENKIIIARSPQQVFDYVTTPANWPRWHPSSLAVRGATDHPLAVGESVVEDFIVAGNRGTVTWTVTAREAPVRWSIEGRNVGSRGGGTVTYTLAPEGGGTRFTRVLTYHMPNLLAAILDDFGVRERVAAESAEAVARLRTALESGPTGPRP
ncbi:MAG TPA: SRPBCC family protein [Burkholderiales bacterium]|nr:SRPBCC family protein [Burkholderiales bacterium]